MKRCRVTFTDANKIQHTAEVEASTLYESVAKAINMFRRNSFMCELESEVNAYTMLHVEVFDPVVTHDLQVRKFVEYVRTPGGSPKQRVERQKLMELLEKK